MKFTCINIQGNLISEEVLNKIAEASASAQSPKDFGLEPGANLRDEIEYAWSRIKLDWKHFSERSGNLTAKDQFGTSLSRKWMEQFFSSLGYELEKHRADLIGGNNQKYSISHTSSSNDGMPVLIVGFADEKHPEKNTLDIKSSGGTSRFSPHGTVQEYLNVTGHVYGFAANGYTLRLIRDSGRLVKLSYLEFDLKRLLDEDKYSEFTVLYRLLHSSRFPVKKEESSHAPIDKYYNESIETGNRIRDGLSLAVKESMVALGNGFLQHPDNDALRQALINKEVTPKQYYDQLRRLVYRLLFLMVTEERDLIYDPEDKSDETAKRKSIYLKHYSIGRLRKLSQHRYLYEASFTDIWEGLANTFRLFEDGGNGLKLGIKPLAGDLFSEEALSDIINCTISNNLLLECLRNLNEFEDKGSRNLVPINYRALDVEELGSVYEGLLELHPVIDNLGTSNPSNANFTFHEGTERKTTGSYYTRPDLVNELIKSALIPVIENRLKEAGNDVEKRLMALLRLKVCDTAAGSGHIILAAARTIGWYLAMVDTGEENPPPSRYRHWLREAIQHCIYAVDMNPDAVELCKLALWLEGHNSGKPLSFLDHKIRCGNSLVGVADLSILRNGIPDGAFDPVTGDDKLVSQASKKANRSYNKTQQVRINFETVESNIQNELNSFARDFAALNELNQNTLDEVKLISKKHSEIKYNPRLLRDQNACDAYTAAFFYTYTQLDDPYEPSSQKLQSYLQSSGGAVEARTIAKANELRIKHKFFHWPLEFPDVFEQGGFDVIMGNPPWEIVELNVKEYFKIKRPEIANASSDKVRKQLIADLEKSDPILYNTFQDLRHNIDSHRKFIQASERFPKGSIGRIDLYPLFLENSLSLISKNGIVSLVLPSDIATGAYNADLFSSIVIQKRLKCYFDFENSKGIFPGVHRSKRFCLLAITGGDFTVSEVDFFYFGHDISDLSNKERRISLRFEELELFSPNTMAPPIFHTAWDYKLSRRIYSELGVFIDKKNSRNVWEASIKRMLSLSDKGVDFTKNISLDKSQKSINCRMYSGKNIWQFNHRFASNSDDDIYELKTEDLKDPFYYIETEYYVPVEEINSRIGDKRPFNWLIGYRDVTNATNERTTIASILPRVACDTNCRNIYSSADSRKLACLIGVLNSLVFDYLARQKIIGLHLNAGTLEQLPILHPSIFDKQLDQIIVPKVLELTYTSWDIKPFADDIWTESSPDLRTFIQAQWDANKVMSGCNEWSPPGWCEIDSEGCSLPPFKWNEERRTLLKAELDAIYAKLYGLTTEELCYILDPQDVYGPDFPGETFRVLKEKEIKQYGEYRTRRLVLEAWERLNKENP